MSASRLEDAIRAPAHACRLVVLAALAAAGIARADGVHVQLTPSSSLVAPGDTIVVSAVVTPADSAFNAFDLVFRFDPARVTFVPQYPTSKQIGPVMTSACAQIFHSFAQSSDSLTASLSLLCANKTVTGPGTIYAVKFRASTSATGSTTISCGPATAFYNGGVYVTPVACTAATVTVGAVGVGEEGAAPRAASQPTFDSAGPSPRRTNDPLVLSFRLTRPSLVGVDLVNARGVVVSQRAAEGFATGAHRITWRTGSVAAGEYWVRLRITEGDTLVRRSTVVH